MTAVITGIGTAIPAYSALQEETARYHAELCGLDDRRTRTLRALYRRSGVTSRGSVLLDTADGPLASRQSFYAPARSETDRGPSTSERMTRFEVHAPELALQAAGRALDDAKTAPEEVTHLVIVSCTGFVSPGVDARLVEGLGMGRGVERTQVGFMGCHGALNGMRLARGFVEANPAAVVLLCAVELCSLHFAFGWDPDTLVANALFADGSGAMVLRSRTPGSQGFGWALTDTATFLFPDSSNEMTWRIGDHGYHMTLSPRVPDLIQEGLGEWIGGWLEPHGLHPDDVASWAIHPGGPRILDAASEALGLDRSRTESSRSVLAAHGNMSSATILFILDALRKSRAPLPCVGLAFGPGLVVEGVLLS